MTELADLEEKKISKTKLPRKPREMRQHELKKGAQMSPMFRGSDRRAQNSIWMGAGGGSRSRGTRSPRGRRIWRAGKPSSTTIPLWGWRRSRTACRVSRVQSRATSDGSILCLVGLPASARFARPRSLATATGRSSCVSLGACGRGRRSAVTPQPISADARQGHQSIRKGRRPPIRGSCWRDRPDGRRFPR